MPTSPPEAAQTMLPTLSQRLREATRQAHTEAERAGAMRSLLRGELPRSAYCQMLFNLWAIYQALEQGLDQHAARPALAALPLAELRRAPALAADLAALHGQHWAQELPLLGAAQSYVQRLRELSNTAPDLLVAHAYVRYLGDLSGGQILTQRVGKAYALTAPEGLAFYDFGTSAQLEDLKLRFRRGLEFLAAFETEAQAVVQEACDAFERHRMLFLQLEQAD